MINKGIFCLDFNFYNKTTNIFAFFIGHKHRNKILTINREGWFKSYEIN